MSPPPRVSGFSMVRNAIKYGYPVAESLRSLAPLVDEVAVGKGDYGTLELVRSPDLPDLRVIETVWDESLRVVRNNGRVWSVGDAAGFGRVDGSSLRFRRTGAEVYHYGWARAPEVLKQKTLAFQKLYHDGACVAARYEEVPPEYLSDVDIAFRFRGTHPAVMAERVGGMNWEIPADRRPSLDTPLLNPRFYAAWLRKWRVLPRR